VAVGLTPELQDDVKTRDVKTKDVETRTVEKSGVERRRRRFPSTNCFSMMFLPTFLLDVFRI
jgi:hypothetical protein